MSKRKDKTNISGVKATRESHGVERTESVGNVSSVGKVKGASGVGSVKGAGAISGRKGVISGISREQRDRILALVGEEAERMAQEGTIPKSKKDLVKKSVVMALDAAITLDEDEKVESSKGE